MLKTCMLYLLMEVFLGYIDILGVYMQKNQKLYFLCIPNIINSIAIGLFWLSNNN